MKPAQFLAMVNSFDATTKVNLKKMLYGNEASNIRGNAQSFGGAPPMTRDSNPLCDEIHNTRVPNLQ